MKRRTFRRDPSLGRGHVKHTGTLDERLYLKGVVDLRGNSRIIDMGGGYDLIEPIDPTKLWPRPDSLPPGTPRNTDQAHTTMSKTTQAQRLASAMREIGQDHLCRDTPESVYESLATAMGLNKDTYHRRRDTVAGIARTNARYEANKVFRCAGERNLQGPSRWRFELIDPLPAEPQFVTCGPTHVKPREDLGTRTEQDYAEGFALIEERLRVGADRIRVLVNKYGSDADKRAYKYNIYASAITAQSFFQRVDLLPPEREPSPNRKPKQDQHA